MIDSGKKDHKRYPCAVYGRRERAGQILGVALLSTTLNQFTLNNDRSANNTQ